MAEKRTQMQAQDKLAFLLSLVPYLMDHDRVSVAEAARHFGVSKQQIRDAVMMLVVSGIPGDTRTYQPEDLFDIAWDDFEEHDEIVLTNMVAIDETPRFSAREAAALIAGLQYLSALPEHADRAAIASLTDKLSRGASALPAAVAVEGSTSDETISLIRQAVEQGVQLGFDYLNARGERERRRVDPLRVDAVDTDWYLRGWDHTREAFRTFRLDRMSAPEITDEPINHRSADVPVPDTLFVGSSEDLTVTIDIAPSALSLLGDYLDSSSAPVEVPGGLLRVTIRVAHYHSLKRLIAGMPGLATVISPDEARAVVQDWAMTGADRYAE
ncbi:WYL domain-containing protein [Diaminobutyricimonas sp. TR449]|uniref:helix-turn-helix transcriptional regulator n=1 Tax=Diaminobutyricimonas sp. TR449 TaxID=2708076 RepID=UPI00142226C4|nr:WYL domain-containing protein [Diaminobutyricimonas sp. TR449]